jgi:AcrR family transcriptional regulator
MDDGPEALTLRAIARRAGITAPSIYAHFSGLDAVREALVVNSFKMLADDLQRAIEGGLDPVARLRAVCYAYVAFCREHPNEYAVLFTREGQLVGESADLSIDTIHGAQAFGYLLDGIHECVASGASRSSSPTADATALWVAVHGFAALNMALPNFPWPPDTELLDVLIDRLALLT